VEQGFILINDHDFLHEREKQFTWEYLEEGPETWQVRIKRIAFA
jgi:uncharacterized protein (DUF2249 family)